MDVVTVVVKGGGSSEYIDVVHALCTKHSKEILPTSIDDH